MRICVCTRIQWMQRVQRRLASSEVWLYFYGSHLLLLRYYSAWKERSGVVNRFALLLGFTNGVEHHRTTLRAFALSIQLQYGSNNSPFNLSPLTKSTWKFPTQYFTCSWGTGKKSSTVYIFFSRLRWNSHISCVRCERDNAHFESMPSLHGQNFSLLESNNSPYYSVFLPVPDEECCSKAKVSYWLILLYIFFPNCWPKFFSIFFQKSFSKSFLNVFFKIYFSALFKKNFSKFFSKIFRQKFVSKIFFPKFLPKSRPKFVSKIFCRTFFFQIVFSNIFSSNFFFQNFLFNFFFQNFLCKLFSKIFCSNFFFQNSVSNIFFQIFFSKIFSPSFFSKLFFNKIFFVFFFENYILLLLLLLLCINWLKIINCAGVKSIVNCTGGKSISPRVICIR